MNGPTKTALYPAADRPSGRKPLLPQRSSAGRTPRPAFFFLWALPLAASYSLAASPPLLLHDYYPTEIDSIWTFQTPAPQSPTDREATVPETTVMFSDWQSVDGVRVMRRDQDNGHYRLELLDPEFGLRIYSLHFPANIEIRLEQPAVLFPARLEVGARYESSVAYDEFRNGRREESGIQHYQVEVLPPAQVVTPAGTFQGCLRLRSNVRLVAENGSETSHTLVETFAPGIGLVRTQGYLEWKNEQGESVRKETVDTELVAATVGDQMIDGENSGVSSNLGRGQQLPNNAGQEQW